MAKRLAAVLVVVLLLVCAGDDRVFSGPRRHPPRTSNWPPAGNWPQPAGWTPTAGRYRRPATTTRAGTRSSGCPPPFWRSCRRTGLPEPVLRQEHAHRGSQDLYKQDWWYRTTFDAPADQQTYVLDFPGINYRADIWLNGRKMASNRDIVGMYNGHELDVTSAIVRGKPNTLAVKVTPERAIQDVNGVELADSWYDWINWRYLGYQGPDKNPANGNSFVPDRNAGIWKPVHLKTSGPVQISAATVNTELPLPDTDRAKLTVYTTLHNYSADKVRGVVRATISRAGKVPIHVEEPVSLQPGEDREISLTPDRFAALTVVNPDLWWPYTMGAPNLYDLRLEFVQNQVATDVATQKFGIRTITQGRDSDDSFADLGTGGNFFLKVNGKDFLVRGATYTPDLLYKYDPDRDGAILHYVKDLGLNMLRLESKISSTRFVEMADELGIPLMYGWMCCNQWEKWSQWDDEDRRVAQESLRSQIDVLRSHPSVFIWANGSDGRPRPRCWRTTTAFSTTCTGRTRRWIPCRRSPVMPAASRSGTVSRWPGPTVGARRRTGSAAATARPADPRPSRATTNTSRHMPACASSSRPTSCGRSTTPGSSMPGPVRRTPNW